MKKINDSTFNIEKTTMRELNPTEVDQVGGGIITCWVPVTVTISLAMSCFDSCPGDSQQK